MRGPADKTLASIQLDEVAIGASPGAPLTVRLDGTLDATPATITVAAGTLADLARASAHLPFALEARAAGARLALDGEVTLPLGRGGKLVLALGGERLDSLASLVRAELPPWGPWSIGGPIAMSSTGYAVPQLTVQVGESRLYGTGRLDLAGARPSLSAHIRAPHVQLDDFPFDAPRERAPGASRTEQLRATVRDTARQTEALLSRAFLRRFDASLVVEVGQVLSGADRLGGGQLGLELVDGLLAVEPLMVNLPGGGARLYASYDTRGREVDLVAGARIERFDYGVLARRNRPDADIQGLLSLDMEIRSRAPSLDAIFARADGHIDFAVWPRDLRGGVLDRWAVNLFLALLPFLDPGSGSKVNCLVGRLDLDGGVLTHDALVIDTTRVRALGSGRADLRTEEIAFRFRPRARGGLLQPADAAQRQRHHDRLPDRTDPRRFRRGFRAPDRVGDHAAARDADPWPAAARRRGRVHRSAARRRPHRRRALTLRTARRCARRRLRRAAPWPPSPPPRSRPDGPSTRR
ncbi:MAG: AsmA-like C-terminal region-containing protein [Burkholderiales bacterium]|nr:AsmA-like C-terminal region-containing protein [Burkholderiales bacterium]